MKKSPFYLVVFAFLLFFSPNIFHASGDSVPTPAINYLTEVKVKLLPDSTKFSVTPRGNYEIVNVDTQSLVPFSASASFEMVSGKVQMISGSEKIASAKGFLINEVKSDESNEVKVSKIQTANGVADTAYRGSFEIKPGQKVPLLINRLDIENYLKGVVPSEMPTSWHMEALKAQAVSARSYAYTQIKNSAGNGYLEMTVSSQVYGGKSKESDRGNQAVNETKGIYATYNNVPINAFFHSTSGGHTEDSENVWGSAVPYIRAVDDSYDKMPGNTHYGWETIGKTSVISQKLKLSGTQVLTGLKVTERGSSNAVTQMTATVYDKATKQKTNIALKPSLVATPDRLRSFFGITLKSIKFNVYNNASSLIKLADGTEKKTTHLVGYKIQKADGSTEYIEDSSLNVRTKSSTTLVNTVPTEYTFKGDGWGHLLGLSQWGARGMAEAGYGYEEILKHYYTGIEVKTIN
ncbi:SpoIID/LytB domain-containing protein [Cytobacillus massiliigabonensis]|uniref:SpoIID/LytB domain-containing protein n=1 Tax=Cytobacillus massiliigabonensis TaxID=1871011 RepID=UPI0015E0D67B|nr:SpoIID/LytB domain-containing protein [Cytobacillus massiliigabonensis]